MGRRILYEVFIRLIIIKKTNKFIEWTKEFLGKSPLKLLPRCSGFSGRQKPVRDEKAWGQACNIAIYGTAFTKGIRVRSILLA